MTGFWVVATLGLVFAAWWAWRKMWRAAEVANEVDWGGYWINRIDGLLRLLCRRYHRLGPVQLDIPENGPAIVIANHISGLDPFIVICSCQRPVRFLIAREEYERFGLRWLFRRAGCIPVDRATQPEKAMREAVKVLAAGEVVGLFPQGEIVAEPSSKKLKGGAIRLAQITQASLYPMVITGVKGRGLTALALFIRSRVQVQPRPLIECKDLPYAEAMSQMAEAIREAEQEG